MKDIRTIKTEIEHVYDGSKIPASMTQILKDGRLILFSTSNVIYEWQVDTFTILSVWGEWKITQQDYFGLRVIGDPPEWYIEDAMTNYDYMDALWNYHNLSDDELFDEHYQNGRIYMNEDK
ncbi:hypothetical protein FY046_01770 [Erwinia sp. 1181_3]|uniref:hypothetical protein n=1 Tax=Erwinia sp. 1181_3 TaxID=2605957 RepID=UPI0040581AAD